mmetsp:Transcript_26392/g.47395  ORF Transcript_26392/g.47395 Transcript_26392/m.47395 type:complete len:420 (+) Transcript_26392:1029-2288(+)
MLLLLFAYARALKVAMVNDAPYTGLDSIASSIWTQAALEAGLDSTIVEVEDTTAGTKCVLTGDCDSIVSYEAYSDLVATHPLLYDRPVLLTFDDRMSYVRAFLWQFLALIATLILPLVLIAAHALMLIEPTNASYFDALMSSTWNVITLAGFKKPLARLIATILGAFVLFVMVLIIADLSSVFASKSRASNLTTEDVDESVCSTADWGWDGDIDTAENCFDSLDDGEVDWVAIGKLQLGYELKRNDWEDKKNLLLKESLKAGKFWNSGWAKASEEFYAMDKALRRLWQDKYVDLITEDYAADIDLKTSSDYSLAFGDPAWMLAGITIVCIILAVLIGNFIYRTLSSENNANETLSLDKLSIENPNPPSRPNEWVEKAVPLDDEAAPRIKDVKDYEKEVSAVPAQQWSGGVSESLLALLK